MSDLLQQAIIDATALKEAAIKNAENTLIEKYSHEFKSTVQRLLEQEELASTSGTPEAVPPQAAAPVQADANAALPQADVGAQPVADAMQAAPTAEVEAQDPLSIIPPSFADADDEELITINFSDLKKTLQEMMGVTEKESISESYAVSNKDIPPGASGGSQSVASAAVIAEDESESVSEGDMEESLELDEEFALEELQLDEQDVIQNDNSLDGLKAQLTSLQQKKDGMMKSKQGEVASLDTQIKELQNRIKQLEQNASKQPTPAESATTSAESSTEASSIGEDLQITEEELMELAEQLKVDINVEGQARGYMGSTTTEKRMQRDAELAASRDDAAAEKREEEKEKMEDLIKENLQLKAVNEEMMNLMEALKVQIEKMNLSNAKLLYTNKALVNISLNERQKNHIAESISKAGSVLEAKTVFETLQSTVESVKKEEKAPKSLSEALNRAQSPFVAKKSTANSINDMQAHRMKLLAGIKTNK